MNNDTALPILRSLADGVNPVTGEAYPIDSPYGDARTLRALYTAVDCMQREVERDLKRQKLPKNFGVPWTAAEDSNLRDGFNQGNTIFDLAHRHQRTQSSIRLRLEKLGLLIAVVAEA